MSRLAARIAQGELDVAIVCGAEALATVGRALRDERELPWEPLDDGAAPTEVVGSDRAPATPEETEANLIAPIVMYPLFENALWALEGTTLDEHRARLGELWAGFSRVAAANPYAWSPQERSAAEIATPSADNRLVTLPYTKLLNSNIQTDQAAALILCSDAVARELGIDRERWVHPHAAGHAYDHWFVSERENLHSSPAIRFAGARGARGRGHRHRRDRAPRRLLLLPERRPDRLPGARHRPVRRDAPADGDRRADVRGRPREQLRHARHRDARGAPARGPRIARADDRRRLVPDQARGRDLRHGRAAAPFTAADVQARVDATPTRASGAGVAGTATGESASLVYSREGEPTVGALTALLPDGRRAIAKTTDPGVLAALSEAPVTGREVVLDGQGGVRL